MEEKNKTKKVSVVENKTDKKIKNKKIKKINDKAKKEVKNISTVENIENTVLNIKANDFDEKKPNENNDFIKNAFKENAKSVAKQKDGEFKHFSSYIVVFIILFVMLFLGIYLGSNYVLNIPYLTPDKIKTEEQLLKQIGHHVNIIKNKYNISNDDLLKGAVNGMLQATGDSYATVIEKGSNFDILMKGNYEGVGLRLITDVTGKVLVHEVLAGSDAETKGILVGDQIIQVDDMHMENKTSNDIAKYVKENTDKKNFDFTIKRNNEDIKINLIKKIISLPSVISKIHDINNKKIGYIKIELFAENTYEQFKEKINLLEKENINSLIIDVRDNGGGNLYTVSDILSLMVSNKHVIYQDYENGTSNKVYSKGKSDKTYPIVVLINENSASGSEMLAGSLRDNLNAELVGVKTFGKGSVQTVENLNSNVSYKITTRTWLTPNGDIVNKVGINPTVEIKMDLKYYETLKESEDNQLQKAFEILSSK